MTKKLFIKTYGCQMNVYDSSRMADVLAPLGYAETSSPQGADMVILNTCHIREKAAEKVFSELGRLRELQTEKADKGERMVIAVAGCVAQAEGEEILKRAPYVDIVLGPQTYHRLPEMIARAERRVSSKHSRGILDTEFPLEPKFDHLPQARAAGSSAFVSVQEGCDKFCTFCVVPYTRGAEYSRSPGEIIDEIKHLAANGVMEVTLLGQNVNAYHGEAPDGKEWGLGRLIRELAEIDGLKRIRYTTSHPRDMDEDLIEAHRDVEALMPYLHLPVQSGSNRILEAMNRQHDRDSYIRLAEKLKDIRPDLALSSDFIVGFPGETDQDFEDTLDLVRRVGFIQAYSFKYSPRPGTPAAIMDRHMSEEVKAERLAVLQSLLAEQTIAFNRSCIGRVMPVLLDRDGKKDGQFLGRSPYMQPVHVNAPNSLYGTIVDLEIIEAGPNSLGAVLVEKV